jgi:16S rRNA (cytosine967-C5)-methyltransferase
MTSGPTPARRCAFAVLRRTFEDGAYTDRALRAEARRARLEGRELALARQLAFGVVQRRGTLDHLIAALADRPAARLDPPVRAALRLGLFQLCWLDGVPDHAAADQSVALVRGPARGLVNAVLRRGAREARGLVAALPEATPEEAALRHSLPEWVARMWWDALGPDQARALMAACNEPAETALRVNTLVAAPGDLAARLRARPAEGLPEGLVLEAPLDVSGNPEYVAGALQPQSRASMLVSRVVGPQPGERVLDLCAAPGAKATHLAALMDCRGEVVAVESNPGRAAELRENCVRLRAGCVAVREGDARDEHGKGFDRVLVDPPCTGLGTLRGRPDLRWRLSPAAVPELASLQQQILAAAARAVRPGGTVVYSTCTISPAENEAVVGALLESRPDLAAEDLHSDHPLWKHPHVANHLLLMPHRDGTDGFFIARLRRNSDAKRGPDEGAG